MIPEQYRLQMGQRVSLPAINEGFFPADFEHDLMSLPMSAIAYGKLMMAWRYVCDPQQLLNGTLHDQVFSVALLQHARDTLADIADWCFNNSLNTWHQVRRQQIERVYEALYPTALKVYQLMTRDYSAQGHDFDWTHYLEG